MVRKQLKTKIIKPELNRLTSKNIKSADLTSLPLKDRFLLAVVNGEIGRVENSGVIVSLKEFKARFKDIKSDYINSFLPAATIEPGQLSVTKTKYVFRVKKGVYLVHPEALEEYRGLCDLFN
ncbi:MAG: hypothetical protein OQK98_12485 [Gammaproteobacteria bacterium]|nr:hypothetical protein [Gammaproteobacteria bacterium]